MPRHPLAHLPPRPNLPVENQSVDVAVRNCLFNIFKAADLRKAIAEMYRVLHPRGRLVLSDPI